MKTAFHFMMFKTFHAQRNRIRQNMQEFGLSPAELIDKLVALAMEE